ncbi:MAG: SusD/RagB family nutrient-binding outer membrane lipoprotein [Prevotella sp.]|nr:SusD/RagB family nutrient-binding outer membrane lipoprotein [Prevotella sp.]
MRHHKIFISAIVGLATLGLSSCLNFDDPIDTLTINQEALEDSVYHGNPAQINYNIDITEAQFDKALESLQTYLKQAKGGQYSMRGGKNGDYPGEHAYQRQYSLGPDNYAQYTTVPHYDFMYGTLQSSYDVSAEFNGGPNGLYLMVKNAMVPLLNHPAIDSIPEMKAIYLLMFDFSTQEIADVHGALPYDEFLANKQHAPFTYNGVEHIYKSIVAHIDLITDCLRHFETRPDWYKAKLQALMDENLEISKDKYLGNKGMDSWIRFANSLKLRIAMHCVKAEPELARKWAEEAVAGGVIESADKEFALMGMHLGFTHPLNMIWITWNDARMSASFESLLMSLNHPYVKGDMPLFNNNSSAMVNTKTGDILEPDTRIVGLREGIHPGMGQSVATNPMLACSVFEKDDMFDAPLYLMKMSEVDFLRAEGAVRGWNMGGTAQFFYERGIREGYIYERSYMEAVDNYTKMMTDYMAQTSATPYTYHDPLGNVNDEPSVTKIGVKWDEGDSPETKLEKIITQKYIANFPNSFESWVDLRRTGYPRLFPVLNADEGDGTLKYGDIIRRAPFPDTDDASVADIIATGLDALGGEDWQSTRIWWDKDVPNF